MCYEFYKKILNILNNIYNDSSKHDSNLADYRRFHSNRFLQG